MGIICKEENKQSKLITKGATRKEENSNLITMGIISKEENRQSKHITMVNIKTEIKSFYIIKKIFSYLKENKKLDLIVYNNSIQKMMGYNLEDYKKVSGKYKVAEKNGKGKEFLLSDKTKLIFKGEYLNGKKNGKGKEYFEGKKIFEGKYLNGMKIEGKGYNNSGDIIFKLKERKGEEYYSNGKLKFRGEYINHKRWNGKGYNINGVEEFEIKNGNGFEKEYNDNDKLIFEGEFVNGIRKGREKNIILVEA